MAKKAKTIAVFPGTFDPVTYGHLDIVDRASRLFDELVVAVGHNPAKDAIFTQDERVELIQPLVAKYRNVRVASYSGLTFDFVRSLDAKVILRGIRDMVDLRSELQQANTNLLVGNVETVFMLTSHDHVLTSSELIKQIVSLGGFETYRKKKLVPPSVVAALNRKLGADTAPGAPKKSRSDATAKPKASKPRSRKTETQRNK